MEVVDRIMTPKETIVLFSRICYLRWQTANVTNGIDLEIGR